MNGPAEPDASAVVRTSATKPISRIRADGRTLEFDRPRGTIIQSRSSRWRCRIAAGFVACGIDTALPDGQPDPGLIIASDTSAGSDDFVAAIAKHRHFARETDPPRV